MTEFVGSGVSRPDEVSTNALYRLKRSVTRRPTLFTETACGVPLIVGSHFVLHRGDKRDQTVQDRPVDPNAYLNTLIIGSNTMGVIPATELEAQFQEHTRLE